MRCPLIAAIIYSAMLAIYATSADGQIIGRAISSEPDLFVSFDQPSPDYNANGKFTDRLGIIRLDDSAPFFGVVDTVKLQTMHDRVVEVALWTFDIDGFESIRISANMAAMGDFENGNIDEPSQDALVFEYSIDGGAFEVLFQSFVIEHTDDHPSSQGYQMGFPVPETLVVTLSDPLYMSNILSMSDIVLKNVFQTISADISASGSQLEIRFRAITDGGNEAFAFRNLIAEAIDGGSDAIVGDYDGSGSVDQADLDLVLLHWGGAGPPPAAWTTNLPIGAIDQGELDGVLLNWGATTAPAAIIAIPEPATLPLIICLAAA